MKLLALTQADGKSPPVYFNPQAIAVMFQAWNSGELSTAIGLVSDSGDSDYWYVEETPEEILAALAEIHEPVSE